jgi:hypothetical protein
VTVRLHKQCKVIGGSRRQACSTRSRAGQALWVGEDVRLGDPPTPDREAEDGERPIAGEDDEARRQPERR